MWANYSKSYINFFILKAFNDFELEPHEHCTYDHVEIFDGSSAEAPTMGKFCGSKIPDPVVSNSNAVFLVFYTDASVQRKGFHATHTSG